MFFWLAALAIIFYGLLGLANAIVYGMTDSVKILVFWR